MSESNRLLAVAAVLGVAAYVLVQYEAEADTPDSGGSDVSSSNGFAINNPLNIRYLSENAFNGQTGNHNGYGVYDTLSNGVRAAGLQLTAYYNRGLTTIRMIVSTWAPSSENNTTAYIADVSNRMGYDADEPLSWPEDQVSLIQAMAYHENGYNNMTDSEVAGYVRS